MVQTYAQPFPSPGLLQALGLPVERALCAQQQGMQGLSAQWRREVQIGCGLQNLGNSCYLNSVLQCLAHLPPLANSCLAKQHTRNCRLQKENRPCICCTFERQVNSMLTASSVSSGYRTAVAPSAIYNSVHALNKNLQRGRQEDSHELLRSLVDAMERNLLRQAGNYNPQRPPKHPRTVVNQLFGGILQSQVHCLQCGHASRTCDPCMDLSLELGATCTSVEDALRRFTTVEKLDGDNKYRCEGCKQLVPAHKQMTVYDDPNVLVIHLKRFDGIFGAKISREIAFSETLDLEPYVCANRRVRCGGSSSSSSNGQLSGCSSSNGYISSNGHSNNTSCLNNWDQIYCNSNSSSSSQQQQFARTSPGHYVLHGVLVHHGYSANSGHYLAYVKDGVSPNGHWHCMNDSQVYRVNVPTVLKQQAYMLFYVRTSMKQQALLPKQTEQEATAAVGSPGRLKRSSSAVADGQQQQQQQQRMIGPQLPPYLQVKRLKVQDDNRNEPTGQHQHIQQQQQQQPVGQPEQQPQQQSGPVFGPQLPPWYSSRRKSSGEQEQQAGSVAVGQLSGVAAGDGAGDSGKAATAAGGDNGGRSGQFFAWAKSEPLQLQQQQQQDFAHATPSSSLPPEHTKQQQQQQHSNPVQLPSLDDLRVGFDERLKPVTGEVRSWLWSELAACKARGMTAEQCRALCLPQLKKHKLIRGTIQQYFKLLANTFANSGASPSKS